MEVICRFIDADSLMSIMALPDSFRNQKLEIIVLPTDGQDSAEKTRDVANIVQSLIGAIPHTELSLDELRKERLGKYETAY